MAHSSCAQASFHSFLKYFFLLFSISFSLTHICSYKDAHTLTVFLSVQLYAHFIGLTETGPNKMRFTSTQSVR